ncbi:MAG: asparagine synthase (glutamine-hydrolyzing) [Desulfobacula sp.]|nr:asparagine synthase (glutamine-hydrolyzing) [Desulfobacula sp.]
MCGIAGLFSLSMGMELKNEAVSRMLKAMHHRGPNASNLSAHDIGVLGHSRLSVIDLSADSHQPMRRGDVWIAYNGEVYNFQEERKLLELKGLRFFTKSDTEVLLALYEHYGEQFVTRLRGIFAFALYDERTESLLCARDHLGIKPFLYSQQGGDLIFASEIKALLASGRVSRETDRTSLHALMRIGSVPQPRTILRDVRCLMPGHMMHWKNGKLNIKRYWQMETGRVPLKGLSYQDLMEATKKCVTESLKLQLVADVPLGAFLSGGIDSSLLVALMQHSQGNVRTFSVGFESGLNTISYDETNDAEMVAGYLGCRHETIIVERSEILKCLPIIARDLDHPTVDGVNSWFVSRAAAQELTVAISGTGGDELFAGYPWFNALFEAGSQPAWKRWLQRCLKKDDFIRRYAAHYSIFSPEQTLELCPDVSSDPLRLDPLPTADVLERVTGLTLSGYTGNQLLFDIDTASMAHSLEVRVPLLDVKLLDFALSLPPEAKIGLGNATAPTGSYAHTGIKRILLDIGKDMLPPEFTKRTKRGFTLPFDGWLRSLLRDTCRELLSEEVVRRRGFFSPAAAISVWSDFENHKAYWPQVWILMMTELWAQQVLDA